MLSNEAKFAYDHNIIHSLDFYGSLYLIAMVHYISVLEKIASLPDHPLQLGMLYMLSIF